MAFCRNIIVFILLQLVTVAGNLYGAGCEEGWLHHGHYCYMFVVNETKYDTAALACEDMGADLASLWTQEERTFVTNTLWQDSNANGFLDWKPDQASMKGSFSLSNSTNNPIVTSGDFAWFGLHGTQDNTWAYMDRSDVIMSDGVLSSSSGEPASKTNKCGAFMGTGGLAFLDCTAMTAQAYICKKALPRVFATSSLFNHTIPDNSSPSDHSAQLFERVWPPLLLAFPQPSHYLAEGDTISETGCAFRCYNVHGCNAFQVKCITSEMCRSMTCILLSQI